ncbi:hypothetical protein FHW12_001584 [Dokdonella fugitiva]|uniref:Uncharacterized protein n=1 Tax=Dokdonella fugitiva TaxID=328517 RepID=A0A839F2R3_9GAMM|nr:hypothetical protein [Dokdonella fugitiva]
MDAHARGEHAAFRRVELAQSALVIDRERDRLHRPLEHEQEAVGLVDLATAVQRQQRAREAVVLAEQLGGVLVTESLGQCGRIDEVAEHERAQQRNCRGLRYRR